jgi:hypothetical protein
MIWWVLLAASLLVAAPTWAQDPVPAIFVATTGSDTTGDGTPGNPYATITQACMVALPGDRILVTAGLYDVQVCQASGTQDRPLRIESWPSRFGAVLSGGASGGDGVFITAGDWVEIHGFRVHGPFQRHGIINVGANVLIKHNIVHDIALSECFATGGAGINHANANYDAEGNATIANVVVRAGPLTSPPCNLIHGIYHSQRTGKIQNNGVFQAGAFGIHLWHGATDVIITNNLVAASGRVGILIGAGEAPGAPIADNVYVANNIVVTSAEECITEAGATGAGNTYINNLCHGNASDAILIIGGGSETGTIVQDPAFEHYRPDALGDYRARDGSPVIDAGVDSSHVWPFDYLESPRPQGQGVDIGPYERGPVGAPIPLPQSAIPVADWRVA